MGMTFSVSGTEWTITGTKYKLIMDNSAGYRGNIKYLYIPASSSTDILGGERFGMFDIDNGSDSYELADISANYFVRALIENSATRIVVNCVYDVGAWHNDDGFKNLRISFIWYFYPDRAFLEIVWFAADNTTNLSRQLRFDVKDIGGSDPEYKVNGGAWTNFPTSATDVQMTSRLGIRNNGSSSNYCIGFLNHTVTEYYNIFRYGDFPSIQYVSSDYMNVRWTRDSDPDGYFKFRIGLLFSDSSDFTTELDEYWNDYDGSASPRRHLPTFTTGAGEPYHHCEHTVIHGDNNGDNFDEGETTEQIVASSNLVDFTVDGASYKIKKLAMLIHQLYLRTGTVGSPVTRTIGYWKCHDNAANTTIAATVGSAALLEGGNTEDRDDGTGLRFNSAGTQGALYVLVGYGVQLPQNGCPTGKGGTISFNARLRYDWAKSASSQNYYMIGTYVPDADNSKVEFKRLTTYSSGTYWRFVITDSAGTTHYKDYNTTNLLTYCPNFTADATDNYFYSNFVFTWDDTTPSMDLWINGRKVTADTAAVGSAWNANRLSWTNNRIEVKDDINSFPSFGFPMRLSEILTLDGVLDLTSKITPTIDGVAILVPGVKLATVLKTEGTDYNRAFVGISTWVIQLLSDITVDDYQIEVNDLYEVPTTGPTNEQLLRHGTWFNNGKKQLMFFVKTH